MKTYRKHTLLSITILFVTTLFVGCSNDKDKIASLVEQKEFNEAHTRLSKLQPNEKATPEMVSLAARVDFGLLIDSARYYLDHGEYYKAFVCATRADKIAPLSGDGMDLLNGARKRMLSGVWVGSADIGKRKVTLKLNALTSSTFEGTAFFSKAEYESDITGGFFDGKELSATLVYRFKRYLNGPNVPYFVDSFQTTLTGTIEDGVLKLTLPNGNSGSRWTLQKQDSQRK